MPRRINRRSFLKSTAAAGVVAVGVHSATAPVLSQSPNEKLNLAAVGTANKAWHNIEQLRGENFVALCDVDANYLGRAAEQLSVTATYRDFRRMFDAEEKNIDAVVVSTADHTHAPATVRGLAMSKHVYCEKPLTHTVEEARVVNQLAKAQGVATQMGTQIHANTNYRRVVEIIQSGAIGEIGEVYNWCNKGWHSGKFVVSDKPAPAHLDWDLWLGPAPSRPYSPEIHPANWRRFWDYGSGTFGDMACHVMDLPFWALGLRHPSSVSVEGPPVDPIGAPEWVKAEYEFPRDGKSPLKFHWSDGGAHFDLVANTKDHRDRPLSQRGLGILFVGTSGMLVADYNSHQLLPQDRFQEFQPPEKTIPDSIGHWNEWVQACKTGSPTTCNFDYSGTLTETVLLGVAAYRSGQKLEWDAERLMATNTTEAERFISKTYRAGWELGLKG